jgi:hypothetical protein
VGESLRGIRQRNVWLRFLNNPCFTQKNAGFERFFLRKELRSRSASFMMGLLDCIGRSRTNVMAKAAAW